MELATEEFLQANEKELFPEDGRGSYQDGNYSLVCVSILITINSSIWN